LICGNSILQFGSAYLSPFRKGLAGKPATLISMVNQKIHAIMEDKMRTIQLKEAIKQANINMLEKKHKRGYECYPVGKTEFSVWESEQEWGD
jgi:TRAP-type mannitol/chloroaromatic compound transport system substrate-binding protein